MKNKESRAFGAFCRSARAVLGWSQSQLSEKCGLAVPSIARIETNAVNPRHDSIVTIVQTFQKAGLEVQYEFTGAFTISAPHSLFEQAN